MTPPERQGFIEKHFALFKEASCLSYTGSCARFEFKKDSNPRFFRARPVPYALVLKVQEEIDRLLKHGIIEKVHHSERAASIVPVLKGDGAVRICGDYKLTTVHNTGLEACL